MAKDNSSKISNSLLAFLVGISLFFAIVTVIMILTGNVIWTFIAIIILFILLVVIKIITLVILTRK